MSTRRMLIYFILILSPFLCGKSRIQQKDGSQVCLVNRLLSNGQTKLESNSDTDSDSKLSIGLKASIGYNFLLKSVIRESTQQLNIGPFLQRKIANLFDAEFSISYQHFKSRSFSEGFMDICYFDNLVIPITLKFNCLKTSSITLNWNIGAETVIELDGDWELWILYKRNSIFSKGKVKDLEKLFYLHAGIGGDVIVSSRIHLQIGTSLGYCLAPKTTHVISNYPLRVCLGVTFQK